MTRPEQKKFVAELIHNIQKTLNETMDAGKLPEEWDGHELRQWIADKFNDSAAMSDSMRYKRGARRRAYENEVLVRNL